MNIDPQALRALGVELLVAFGSRARGTHRPSSDTDVGVVFVPRIEDPTAELEPIRDALGAGDNVDLVALNHADPLLLREVALDGRVLFDAYPGAWEEFRIRAFKLYMDTEWLRRLEGESLRRRYG